MVRVVAIARAMFHALLVVPRAVVRHVLGRIDDGRIRRGVGPMDRRQRRTATRLIVFSFAMLGLFIVVGATSRPPQATVTPARQPVTYVTPTPTPTPTPELVETPAPAIDEPPPDVHIDVDRNHANLPDGALTGGYCAHKWWC
jgi:hypothetical protein